MWTFLTILLCVIAVLVAKEHIEKEKAHNKEFNAQLKSKRMAYVSSSPKFTDSDIGKNNFRDNEHDSDAQYAKTKNLKRPVRRRRMTVVNAGKYCNPMYEFGQVIPNTSPWD